MHFRIAVWKSGGSELLCFDGKANTERRTKKQAGRGTHEPRNDRVAPYARVSHLCAASAPGIGNPFRKMLGYRLIFACEDMVAVEL